MNDIIKENGKIAAICAGGAFLLSLLVGLITRNPFGIVLLRAILLAALFAALGGAARFLVAKYVPDLLSGAAASPAAARTDEEGRGARVNIVLPEEGGFRGQETGARAPSSAAETGAEAYVDAGGPATIEEAQALGELAGELAEGMADMDAGADGAAAHDAQAEYGMMDEGEAVGMERGDSASLDALPDISGLETAEQGEPAGPPSPRTSFRAGNVSAETPGEAMKGSLSGQDPATLARAIRTVLKNEEKG